MNTVHVVARPLDDRELRVHVDAQRLCPLKCQGKMSSK